MNREKPTEVKIQFQQEDSASAEKMLKYTEADVSAFLEVLHTRVAAYKREIVELSDLLMSLSESLPETPSA